MGETGGELYINAVVAALGCRDERIISLIYNGGLDAAAFPEKETTIAAAVERGNR